MGKLKYEDIHEIVEYLVRTKSNNYTFGSWTREDIAQEIRLICFQKMQHFDPDRVEEGKWQNFFGRCVDNALKNLKRDNYLRTTPPVRVDLEGMSPEELLEFKKTEDWDRWCRFQKNLQSKLKILHPVPIDALGDIKKRGKCTDVEYRDLEQHIIDSISEDLRPSLVLMLNGKSRQVDKNKKRKVQAFIKRILD